MAAEVKHEHVARHRLGHELGQLALDVPACRQRGTYLFVCPSSGQPATNIEAYPIPFLDMPGQDVPAGRLCVGRVGVDVNCDMGVMEAEEVDEHVPRTEDVIDAAVEGGARACIVTNQRQ